MAGEFASECDSKNGVHLDEGFLNDLKMLNQTFSQVIRHNEVSTCISGMRCGLAHGLGIDSSPLAGYPAYITERLIFDLFLKVREPVEVGIEVTNYYSGGMGFDRNVTEDMAENAIGSRSRLVVGLPSGVSIYNINTKKQLSPTSIA